MLDPRTEAVSTQKESWASCSTPNYKCSNIEGVRETREPADGAPCCQSWNHFGSMTSSFCPTIFAHRLKRQILGGSQVSNRQLKLCKVRNVSYRSHLLIGGGWQFVSVTLATVYQEDPSIHLHLVFQEGIEWWPSTQQPSWLCIPRPCWGEVRLWEYVLANRIWANGGVALLSYIPEAAGLLSLEFFLLSQQSELKRVGVWVSRDDWAWGWKEHGFLNTPTGDSFLQKL